MITQQHIVRRLVLELNLHTDRQQAFHLQNEIKRKLRHEISSALDHVFSEMTPNGEVIRIEKLHLDLGKVSKREIGRKFYEQVKKQINLVTVTKAQEDKQENKALGAVEILSSQRRKEDLFFHFLQKGTFPWWAKKVAWETWESKLREDFSRIDKVLFLAKLKESIAQSSEVLDRLTWQFSKLFLVLITKLFEEKNIAPSEREVRPFQSSDKRTYFKEFIEKALSFELELEKTPIDTSLKNQSSDSVSEDTLSERQQKSKNSGFIKPVAYQSNTDNLPEKQQEIAPTEKTAHQNSGNSTQSASYYLNNAGLAIVMPYLVLLFKELNYLNEQRAFKTEKTQARAIHLVQYVATGKVAFPEQELVLNKIVCGWEIEKPIRRNIRLTKKEKQAADDFLKSLLETWGALKNTTPDGLRNSFLIRNGKLSKANGHWLLQVEKAGYDVFLMKKLPWSISIIKNVLMSKRIHVEWIF